MVNKDNVKIITQLKALVCNTEVSQYYNTLMIGAHHFSSDTYTQRKQHYLRGPFQGSMLDGR